MKENFWVSSLIELPLVVIQTTFINGNRNINISRHSKKKKKKTKKGNQ